jgi:hypothetical protein
MHTRRADGGKLVAGASQQCSLIADLADNLFTVGE